MLALCPIFSRLLTFVPYICYVLLPSKSQQGHNYWWDWAQGCPVIRLCACWACLALGVVSVVVYGSFSCSSAAVPLVGSCFALVQSWIIPGVLGQSVVKHNTTCYYVLLPATCTITCKVQLCNYSVSYRPVHSRSTHHKDPIIKVSSQSTQCLPKCEHFHQFFTWKYKPKSTNTPNTTNTST